jgi:hypothetical protein
MDVTINTPIEGQYPVYPQAQAHTWGAFAFLAIEAGGYGDLEAVNPYTGVRLNAPVWGHKDLNPYDALRRLIDEMEEVDFLSLQAAEPKPERDLVAADYEDLLKLDFQFVGGANILASILTKRVGFVVDVDTAVKGLVAARG